MSNQVKTQLIIDWLEGPFYEGLDEDIRRPSLPALTLAIRQLDDGVRFQKAPFGKMTTPAQVASWLEDAYWPIFTRRYGSNAEARHAGAIALDKAVQQLRSGEWALASSYTA